MARAALCDAVCGRRVRAERRRTVEDIFEGLLDIDTVLSVAARKRQGFRGRTLSSGALAALGEGRCGNTKGYSSTYLAMGFANIRAGTRYPPEH